MRFGIFDHFELRDEPAAERYENRLQMIEAADAAGFWCYHKAEHHFTVLDVAPSANLLFAAAAQRTGCIRLGSLVYLLPFYDPVRLLEEICVLDHMTRGRLEVGVGKGVSPVEQRLWGNDTAGIQERFDEAFAILRNGLAGRSLAHDGAWYQYEDLPMPLAPFRDQGPGLWYPGNHRYAGNHRLNTIVGGPAAMLADTAKEYHGLVDAAEEDWNPGVARPTFGVTMHVYVARDDVAAVERVQRAYPVYHRNLISLWDRYAEPLQGGGPSMGGDVQRGQQAQVLVAGSPDTVAAHIQQLQRKVRTDYVVSSFAWGDLSHEEAMGSLGLFAAEVMPRFAD